MAFFGQDMVVATFKGWEPSHIPAHKSLAAAAPFQA